MREGNIAGVKENFCADTFGLIAVTAGGCYESLAGKSSRTKNSLNKNGHITDCRQEGWAKII